MLRKRFFSDGFDSDLLRQRLRLFLFVMLVSLLALFYYEDRKTVENFVANGVVIKVLVITPNNPRAVLEVFDSSGVLKRISHRRLYLNPKKIKAGDSFNKVAGDPFAWVNGEQLLIQQ